MTTLVVPFVGAFHRGKVALAILDKLPAGALLLLEPEPENRYDPKAIRVLCRVCDEVPFSHHMLLDEAIQGSGYCVEDLNDPPFFLGYIADSDGKLAAGGPANREVGVLIQLHGLEGVEARLGFSPQGKPEVIVTVRELAA